MNKNRLSSESALFRRCLQPINSPIEFPRWVPWGHSMPVCPYRRLGRFKRPCRAAETGIQPIVPRPPAIRTAPSMRCVVRPPSDRHHPSAFAVRRPRDDNNKKTRHRLAAARTECSRRTDHVRTGLGVPINRPRCTY